MQALFYRSQEAPTAPSKALDRLQYYVAAPSRVLVGVLVPRTHQTTWASFSKPMELASIVELSVDAQTMSSFSGLLDTRNEFYA